MGPITVAQARKALEGLPDNAILVIPSGNQDPNSDESADNEVTGLAFDPDTGAVQVSTKWGRGY